MTSRDFCFWLQGYLELVEAAPGLTAKQLEAVRKHLALVFKHEIDPSMPGKDLDDLHSGITRPPGGVVMRC